MHVLYIRETTCSFHLDCSIGSGEVQFLPDVRVSVNSVTVDEWLHGGNALTKGFVETINRLDAVNGIQCTCNTVG